MSRGNTWKRIFYSNVDCQRFLWQPQDNQCQMSECHGKIPSITVCIARPRLKEQPHYTLHRRCNRPANRGNANEHPA